MMSAPIALLAAALLAQAPQSPSPPAPASPAATTNSDAFECSSALSREIGVFASAIGRGGVADLTAATGAGAGAGAGAATGVGVGGSSAGAF